MCTSAEQKAEVKSKEEHVDTVSTILRHFENFMFSSLVPVNISRKEQQGV